MIKYKVALSEKVKRIAVVDFPNWKIYEDRDIEKILYTIFKDLEINVKFCVSNKKIDIDPSSDYFICPSSDKLEICQTIPSLFIGKNEIYLTNVEING